jgi:class 3 adenylate cyclase
MQLVFGIPLLEVQNDFRQEFNSKLLSGNLRKGYLISIIGSLFVFPLVYLDILRYKNGILNNSISHYITLVHLFFLLFIPFALYITFYRKTIFKENPSKKKRLVTIITLIFTLSLFPLALLGIQNNGSISVYGIYIMLFNFVITIQHKWRLVINLACVFLFIFFNFLLIDDIVVLVTRILECLGTSAPAFAFATFHYNAKIKEFTNAKLLKKERERSDALLLNILPAQIAEELKQNGLAKPTFHQSATVLFTDFVGFSSKTVGIAPTLLTEILNDYFLAFDDICKRHQLEKIKTIGDAYMAVSGVPTANENHAKNCTFAALEMIDFVKKYEDKALINNTLSFKMRIGLHSGELVAGVVGKEKFSYDIWGETVNIASRIESKSEADQVNVSAATYELINSDFECTHRGKIAIKNLGEVDMYFVISKK